MISRRISAIPITTFALACLVTAGAAYAAGGIYLDDMTLTNYGTQMFTDGFNDSALRGWSDLHDVSLGQVNQGSYLLLMNAHSAEAATAWRQLNVKDAGVVELTCKVLVAPSDEQYQYKNKKYSLLYLVLASGNTSAAIRGVVSLNPKEKGSRASIGVQQTVTPPAQAPASSDSQSAVPKVIIPKIGPQYARIKNSGATSTAPVIQPKTWALVTLKLDSKTSTASVLVDNKKIVSQPYNPSDFQSIRGIYLWSTYGDGVKPKK